MIISLENRQTVGKQNTAGVLEWRGVRRPSLGLANQPIDAAAENSIECC